jgi:acyl carrier protein
MDRQNDTACTPAEPGALAPPTQDDAPQGKLETGLVAIWSDLLEADRIGRHHNFFELGGQSVQAMTLLEKLTERYGVQLPFTAIFKYPTVCQLAQFIEHRRSNAGEEEPL